MKQINLIIVALMISMMGFSQSLELMPGTERVFVDAQWLKPIDKEFKWSLFSRSRATVDYSENANLFTGAYLNYTTNSGLGGTVVGRISSLSSGGDVGVHYFKMNDNIVFYGLLSVELASEFSYSWFSIFRYLPQLNDKWRLYSSLELFSNFNESGHVASVQRLRLGLDIDGNQFGLGLNLSGFGENYDQTDSNPGLFVRKQF